jgi:hypothetical protein
MKTEQSIFAAQPIPHSWIGLAQVIREKLTEHLHLRTQLVCLRVEITYLNIKASYLGFKCRHLSQRHVALGGKQAHALPQDHSRSMFINQVDKPSHTDQPNTAATGAQR